MSDDLDDLLHDLDMIDGLGDNKGKGNNVKLNHHSVGSSSGAGGSNMFPRPPVEKKSPQGNPRGGRFGGHSSSSNSNSGSGTNSYSKGEKSVEDMSIDDLLDELDADGGGCNPNPNTAYTGAASQNNSYGSSYSHSSGAGGNANTNTNTKDRAKNSSVYNGGLSAGSRGASGDDLCGDGQRGSFGSGKSSSASGGRCLRLVLSGDSGYNRGVKNSVFSKTACDNLRCSSCNFKVLLFKNSRWNDGDGGGSGGRNKAIVDYMFFRNNMPNVQKLDAGIISGRSVGSCAYCCQCSWVTVAEEEIEVNQVQEGHVGEGGGKTRLPWICAGH